MYLVLTRSYPPEVGGMQNLMWGLTKTLSKHFMIKVFADYHKEHKKYDKEVSFTIERVSGVKLFRKYRKAYLVNQFINQNKNIKGIIADHWKSLENINTNLKKICLIHSKEINHNKGSLLNKRILSVLNNVDYVVSNSNFTKELAIKCGVTAEKIIVINPGIEPLKEINKKTFDEAEVLLSNKKPRLITIARFDKRKNHEKIIMTLRNLKEKYPNIIYICIGDGEEEENLKKLTRELGLDNQVLFLKNTSIDLKNALLAKSNIFVMPSIIYKNSVEGFGIVFVEAAQHGVPSIVGKDGGGADAIIHKKTGLICDGNNLNEIYSNICELLDNNKFTEYGKVAKENSKNFHWEQIIKKYKKIIN